MCVTNTNDAIFSNLPATLAQLTQEGGWEVFRGPVIFLVNTALISRNTKMCSGRRIWTGLYQFSVKRSAEYLPALCLWHPFSLSWHRTAAHKQNPGGMCTLIKTDVVSFKSTFCFKSLFLTRIPFKQLQWQLLSRHRDKHSWEKTIDCAGKLNSLSSLYLIKKN